MVFFFLRSLNYITCVVAIPSERWHVLTFLKCDKINWFGTKRSHTGHPLRHRLTILTWEILIIARLYLPDGHHPLERTVVAQIVQALLLGTHKRG